MTAKTVHTPLMQQYHDIKKEYPDTLIFFQVGDFYELFFEDAQQAASFLGIALTTRGKNNGEPIPLCGVPIHAKDHYVAKLVKGGFKVALCDQVEEAQAGKLVKREITQVLTPGTLTDSNLLDDKSSSYLFTLYPGKDQWALVFGELLTAQIWATVIPAQSERILESELARFFPDELLLPRIKEAQAFTPFFKKRGYNTTLVDAATDFELPVFQPAVQKAVDEESSLRMALKYFYAYLSKNQHDISNQFTNVFIYQPDDFLHLDAATQRNLELVANNQDGTRSHTLLSVLDHATTPMGARMIKKWLQRPLLKKTAIEHRLDAVQTCVQDVLFSQVIQQLLSPIGDVERVVGRIALGRSQLHDYIALTRCLGLLPEIIEQLQSKKTLLLFKVIVDHLGGFGDLFRFLRDALPEDVSSNEMIKSGFDVHLDAMRELIATSNQKLLHLEKQEQGVTGIGSLKLRYNAVYGYYIEVTNPNKHLVPERYVRRQTLAGRERYVIPELQDLEAEIMHARSQVDAREAYVFEQVKLRVSESIGSLRKLAHALAHIDALHGFAKVAYNNGYTRPLFHDSRDIMIEQGRHPVIETQDSRSFVPNNTFMDDNQSLWIITGPNMGGKSTYLRQVALMSIMAQSGSFVSAKQAVLPLCDRVFTRIGAGDNLAAGKSTFLVEMEETASICTQATKQSLVILDEVGRGTSTFDGLAIAQSVVEYLHAKVGARCLFATHYHELTLLAKRFAGIASFYTASKKTDSGIVFLYTILEGVADGSFGLEVAKLAELPSDVITRAHAILETLTIKEQLITTGNSDDHMIQAYESVQQENSMLKKQLAQLNEKQRLMDDFKRLDFDDLSPRKAFDLLWNFKQQL